MNRLHTQAIEGVVHQLATLSTNDSSEPGASPMTPESITKVHNAMLRAERKARLRGQLFLADVTHEIYMQCLSNTELWQVVKSAICGTSTEAQNRMMRKVFEDAKETVVCTTATRIEANLNADVYTENDIEA